MPRKIFLLCAALVLVACASPTPNPFSLTDTQWRLVSVTENGATKTPPTGIIVTLHFARDKQVRGNAGCNSFSGTYETQGEILKITALASTLMACLETEKMEFEGVYLLALQNAQLFEKRGNALTITFANGNGRLNLNQE